MAIVREFKEKPGQMFGGAGAAVFRPFDRSKPAAKAAGSEQSYPTATEVEHALQLLDARVQQELKDSANEK